MNKKERKSDNENPNDLLTRLFSMSGGLQAGIDVARRCVGEGLDPVSEARSYAERGILQGAMEFVIASGLSPVKQIDLAYEVAEKVLRKIGDNPSDSLLDEKDSLKTMAIMQSIRTFLDSNPTLSSEKVE